MNNKGLVVSLSLSIGVLALAVALPRPALGDHSQSSQPAKATCGRPGPGGSRCHAALSRRQPGGGRGIPPALRLRQRARRRRHGPALRQHGAGRRRCTRPEPPRDRHLRAAAEWRPPPDRRGLSRLLRRLACQQHWHAGAWRAAHAPDRGSESLSACRPSTRCTSGRGSRIRPVRS